MSEPSDPLHVAPLPTAAAPPPAPEPVAESEDLVALRAALRKAEQPSHIGLRTLLFLGTAGLFVYFMRDAGPLVIAVVVGVLVFHEAGHFVAMRVFGYENLKVFFIPFLGAAVSGRASKPGGWRAGVVSLAGPVPGLLLGIALVPFAPPGSLMRVVVVTLVYLNGINLLPFLPLDGGRLLNLVIFSRHRLLELGAMVVGTIGLVAVPGLLPGQPYLWVGLLVGSLINRSKVLEQKDRLRRLDLRWEGKTSELPAESLAALESAAGQVVSNTAVRARTSTITSLHDELSSTPAAIPHAVALFLVWAAAGAGAWVIKTELETPRPWWTTTVVLDGRAEVTFPMRTSKTVTAPQQPGVVAMSTWSAPLGTGEAGLAEVTFDDTTPDYDAEPALAEERLTAMFEAAFTKPNLQVRWKSAALQNGVMVLDATVDDSNGTTIYLRYFFVHRTVVMLITSGLELGVHQRFVESFKRL